MMPIENHTGSIFESDAKALVNPVNQVGVMGAGLAAEFAARYPEMLDSYMNFTEQGLWNKGIAGNNGHAFLKRIKPHWYWVENSKRVVINFATKRHWKGKSTYKLIADGLDDLSTFIHREQLKSIAIPRLGCGRGGLQWGTVRKMLETFALELDDDVVVELWSVEREA